MQRGHNSRDLWTNKRGRIKNRNFCFPTTLLTVEVAVHIPMQTVIRYSMEIDSLMLPPMWGGWPILPDNTDQATIKSGFWNRAGEQ